MSSWLKSVKVYAKPKQTIPFYYDISNTTEVARTFLELLGAFIYSKKMNERCVIYDPNEFISLALMSHPSIKTVKVAPENSNMLSIKTFRDITANMKYSEMKSYAADIFKYDSLFNQSIIDVLQKASIRAPFDMAIHITMDASGANLPFYVSAVKEYQKRTKKATLNIYVMTGSYETVTQFQALCDPSWKLTSLSKFPPTDGAAALFQQLAEVQIFAVVPAAVLNFQYPLDRFMHIMHRNAKGYDYFKELNGAEWILV